MGLPPYSYRVTGTFGAAHNWDPYAVELVGGTTYRIEIKCADTNDSAAEEGKWVSYV